MLGASRFFSCHTLLAQMGFHLSSRWFLTGLSTALVGGLAVAQTQPVVAPDAPRQVDAPRSAGGPPRVDATPQVDASQVSDPEKLTVSSDSLNAMRNALKDVIEKLDEARRSKDLSKLTCVNEKLTQIKGLLRISEQSDVALQEAVARRESATANHEFTKVTIARTKTDQLRAEVEQCMGQLAFRADENGTLEVNDPLNLTKRDTSEVPTSSRTVNSRSPAASPTM